MKTITLENTLGREVRINMPESPDEVPVTKFIDYSMAFKGFLDWYNEMAADETLVQNRSIYVYQLCKIVSEYFDADLNDLIHYDISDMLDDEGQLKVELMTDHSQRMAQGLSDMDEVEDVLLTVALNLNHVVNGYEPSFRTEKDHTFEYKGETWVLPKANILAQNNIHYPKFTVKEVVECMEIQRWAEKVRNDAKKEGVEVDPNVLGSALLTEYLSIFAILCRKEGEDIDLDNFDELVEARIHHFTDLDMKTVRDLLFFSEVTLIDYVKNLIQDSFSTLQNATQETVPNQAQSAKQKDEAG